MESLEQSSLKPRTPHEIYEHFRSLQEVPEDPKYAVHHAFKGYFAALEKSDEQEHLAARQKLVAALELVGMTVSAQEL